MLSKREKAKAARAHAFDLCREGKLSEFRSLLETQEDGKAAGAGGTEAPAVVKLKLSDRHDDLGKSGATFLHM